MKHYLFILIWSFLINSYINTAQYGYVIVPVADLIAHAYGDESHPNKVLAFYNNIPCCHQAKQPNDGCRRIHQLIYGEHVEILDATKDQIQIKIPHVFYITTETNAPQTIYWTLKKNIISETQLKSLNINATDIFPTPIRFSAKHIPYDNIVALKKPIREPYSNSYFSAGTRFLIEKTDKNSQRITLKYLDPVYKKIRMFSIAPSQGIFAEQVETAHQKRTIFIELLKEWSHRKNNHIPYVWGGCSFTRSTLKKCRKVTRIVNQKKELFYDLPYCKTVREGFDCTGLLIRAAQTAGIPFYFKNTFTIANYLPALQPNQKLDVGDLIWIPGHIMIISDLKNNLLIEARAYNQGYGKVHEIPLSRVFHGVETYADLIDHYLQGKPIARMNSRGNVVETFKTFKLLKLTI